MPGLAYITIHFPKVQSRIVRIAVRQVEEMLETRISYTDVRVTLFNRVIFTDFLLEDQQGDTLVYSHKFKSSLKHFDRHEKTIYMQRIWLDGPLVRFHIDSTGTINLKFITDRFRKKDTSSSSAGGMKLVFNEIEMGNGRFTFSNENGRDRKEGINFSSIDLSRLSLFVSGLHIMNDTIGFTIEDLSFIERSGFHVRNWKSENLIHKTFAEIGNLSAQTDHSSVNSPRLRFDYMDFRSFASFIDSVRMSHSFKTSDISLVDLAFFAPGLKGFKDKILFEGSIEGKVSDLKGRNISLFFGGNTFMNGDFNLTGLPEVEETFIFIDVKNLVTTMADIESMDIPLKNAGFSIPENLYQLGLIKYQGNFTGFPGDFVAYGKLSTDLGDLTIDLLFKPDTANYIAYNGTLATSRFMLGRLMNMEQVAGNIGMSASISGNSLKGKRFNGMLEGVIGSIGLNGYQYTNIDLSGKFTEKMFDGSIDIEDPSIKMAFLGLLDFSGEKPEFDFTLNVPRARLFDLNIDKKDTASVLSLLLTANFIGNNLDNLDGDINLLNASLNRNKKEWQVYDFFLSAVNRPDTSTIRIRSDFLDAILSGSYEFADLPDAFRYTAEFYIPALGKKTYDPERLATNDFSYHITLKNTLPFFELFMPGYSVSEGSILEGRFSPVSHDFSFHCSIDRLVLKENYFNRLDIRSLLKDQAYSVLARSDQLILGKNFDLKDIRLLSSLESDSLAIDILWDDKAKLRNMGDFHSFAHFVPSAPGKLPGLRFQFMPSSFMIQDTLWALHPSQVLIDSSSVKVNQFILQNNNQILSVNGAVSNQPADTLWLNFTDLNLALVNLFTNNDKTVLGGIINGHAAFSELYKKPVFSSNLTVNQLAVNHELIGNTTLNSTWDSEYKAIRTRAFSERNEIKTLRLEGSYYPESQDIDFAVDLEKLRLNILRPFLSAVFNDINGMASGNLTLTGTVQDPSVNGLINLQKTSIEMNFLNTRYNFTHELKVQDNSLYFDNVTVMDMNGKSARLNGVILNNDFRDFSLDLTVDAKEFHFLNTTYLDNASFYGNAFGTGVIRISGVPSDLAIDISARTEKNTVIYIPLESGEELREASYVRFINTMPDATRDADNQEYQVNLSGIQMNFNLEITPDAEAQIIFDSKIGDIIRGRGFGSINMEINTFGKFRMFGEYELTDGDYLFTLQNIINKRLEIRPGSKIIWNGDPLDANIDLEAVYHLRTSLYELFMEDTYKRRIPVEAQLFLGNKLMNPSILFDISLPTSDEETRNLLRNAINTEEKLSKQFLSLLILNSFMPDPNLSPGTSSNILGNYTLGAESVGVTTSELLSNQLSRWLSQISNDFDVGFTYRPGDEISSNQLELAMSTQLLNDRVTINGNLDVGGQQSRTQTSNIVGDFNMEVKLTESGKIRVKAFNRANDKLIYEQAPYTQGIGLFYREEFNSFGELFRNYFKRLFRKKEQEPSVLPHQAG